MGAFHGRQHRGVEEIDILINQAYRYPPRSGNYFGTHFIMGGERFDMAQPESYLFGENSDLNFLGSRPTPFPYPPPQPNEPTKTLKCLVNIRKESLRFVRAPIDTCNSPIEKTHSEDESEPIKTSSFNIEFTFDSDVRCAITIYYFCVEEVTAHGVSYIPRNPTLTSKTYRYNSGANQQFCQMGHAFDPSKYSVEELSHDIEREIFPVAIHCVAEEGAEEMRQSHTTIATVEKLGDGTYTLKALKQKLFVDGLCYLIQEIYGIENKLNDRPNEDDEPEDNGSECVICMCDVRDTLILPCRHLCLCNACADSLRYQANNCPICRAPFRALLQIKALQKSTNPNLSLISADTSCDSIPPGFEAVSLIEALNGPCLKRAPAPVPSIVSNLGDASDCERAIQAAQMLNRNESQPESPVKDVRCASPPDYVLVVSGSEDENKEIQKCPLLKEQKQQAITAKGKLPRNSRERLNSINEKSKNELINDEDSESERLSPLLHNKTHDNSLALNVSNTNSNNDNLQETCDSDQRSSNQKSIGEIIVNGAGDDSDYYTPEEQAPTVSDVEDSQMIFGCNSIDNSPQKFPGTPSSHISARSSGDSCSSGSSTRHLLAVNTTSNSKDNSVHT